MKDYEYACAPTSQFYFCGVPFRLDIKPKCKLDCAYCFAASRGGRRTNAEQIINIDSFTKKYELAKHGNFKKSDIIVEMLSVKHVLHIGGMSDPFCDAASTSAFYEIFEILSKDNYPVVISTKKPSSIEVRNALYDYRNAIVQVSLPIINEELQTKIEPYADSVQLRLAMMKQLIDSGVNVVCRVQPIIPQLIDDIPKIIDELEKIGCVHVVFEFLKLPVEQNSMNTALLSEIFEEDMLRHFHTLGAKLIGREWLLPTEYRYKNIIPLKKYANSKGISVSLADYGLYHFSDIDCCCGIDKFGLECEWNKGNFSNLIRNKKGLLYFSDILDFKHPEKSITKYINSHCRIEVNTMVNQLRNRWNKPGTVNAPDCYIGVEYTGKKDDAGDCIYINKT